MFGKKKKDMQGIGVDMVILGLLILLNDYYALVTWASFVGIIVLVAGVKKLMMK